MLALPPKRLFNIFLPFALDREKKKLIVTLSWVHTYHDRNAQEETPLREWQLSV